MPSLTAFLEEDLPRALFFSENFSLKQILEDLTGFLIAVAAGGAILSCYVGLLAYIGSDTRLSNITGVRKAPMVVAAGAAGTLASVWLYRNFVSWLSFLNGTLPPIGAIIITDYFLHRASYKEEKAAEHDINWGAVTGVTAGALIGNFVHHGISSINAIIAACVCYSVSAFAAHSKINRISSDLPQCRTLS